MEKLDAGLTWDESWGMAKTKTKTRTRMTHDIYTYTICYVYCSVLSCLVFVLYSIVSYCIALYLHMCLYICICIVRLWHINLSNCNSYIRSVSEWQGCKYSYYMTFTMDQDVRVTALKKPSGATTCFCVAASVHTYGTRNLGKSWCCMPFEEIDS